MILSKETLTFLIGSIIYLCFVLIQMRKWDKEDDEMDINLDEDNNNFCRYNDDLDV